MEDQYTIVNTPSIIQLNNCRLQVSITFFYDTESSGHSTIRVFLFSKVLILIRKKKNLIMSAKRFLQVFDTHN